MFTALYALNVRLAVLKEQNIIARLTNLLIFMINPNSLVLNRTSRYIRYIIYTIV